MGVEITFDATKLKVVDINEVRPNSWNPKEKDTPELDKIVKSLKEEGLRMPIVVRENNGYEIIDGEQRWSASKRLNADKVIIYNEGLMSDKDAQELTIFYQQQVPFENVSLAKLVSQMVAEYPDIKLPYSTVEIEEFKNVTGFEWGDYDKKVLDGDKAPREVTCPECNAKFTI